MLSVIVLNILEFPVLAAILLLPVVHSVAFIADVSFQLVVVENFASTARITIIRTLKLVNHIAELYSRISRVSN